MCNIDLDVHVKKICTQKTHFRFLNFYFNDFSMHFYIIYVILTCPCHIQYIYCCTNDIINIKKCLSASDHAPRPLIYP